ncbi:hypothetical protein ALC53_10412 [Atta colombica]|uniref:Uncharacterized protein n=1 Tax=Atta colombica TaxID=520822 RepID=A0A195B435_9HYME|nr:hypothetical protein ALC53_10412 [Atta colombica]
MSDESSMTDVQDRAFLLPAVPRINYIAVVPEHDRDKDRGSEMDLRTALKWTQFKATRASRRTTATGLDGTGWEDSIVNGSSQRRTTRRRYFCTRCFASTEHVSYVANTVAGLHFVSTSLDAVDGEVNHIGKRKYPTMSTRNSSGGEIDRVQERSSKLRRKTPRRRFIARMDGNSFVDIAVFVDDNSSPGDPLSFR